MVDLLLGLTSAPNAGYSNVVTVGVGGEVLETLVSKEWTGREENKRTWSVWVLYGA